MKRISTFLLQVMVVLIGLAAFVAMLWEPHLEGRNAHATNFEVYFKDPFLAFAYLASVPFFVGLYQVFKLLEGARGAERFSQSSLKAVKKIKHCGMCMIAFAAVGILWILGIDSDDRAGGVFIGSVIALISFIVTALAAVFEKHLSKMV